MPKIVFTADPKLPRDLKHLGYKKGDTAELPEDQCERWIKRNVAAPYVAPAKTAAPKPAPKTPAPKGAELDPTTAPIDEVVAFLVKHNVTPGPALPEAKVREAALEIITRS